MNNFIEPLESRIAPASLTFTSGSQNPVAVISDNSLAETPRLASASELQYLDANLDKIRIVFSEDVLAGVNVNDVFTFEHEGMGLRLVAMDLTKLGKNPRELAGLDIDISAEPAHLTWTPSVPGDDRVEIGMINAAGIDLGDVSVEGHLNQIIAGDSKLSTAGLKSLTVESLGALGNPTDAEAGDVTSVITGALGRLDVQNDIVAAVLKIQGGKYGDLSRATIGGSVVGGDFIYSGSILADGTIKSLDIGGDIVGGSAERSGFIQAGGGIKTLAIAGGIIGGSEYGAGRIEAVGLGGVKVAEGLHAGTDEYTGSIYSTKNIKSLEVGGLEGGADRGSGAVFVDKSIGKVAVAGDIAGGAGEASGYIQAQQRIGKLTIDGDLSGSNGLRSGSVASFDAKIGKVAHAGGLTAGTGSDSGKILSFLNKAEKHSSSYGYMEYISGFDDWNDSIGIYTGTLILDFTDIHGATVLNVPWTIWTNLGDLTLEASGVQTSAHIVGGGEGTSPPEQHIPTSNFVTNFPMPDYAIVGVISDGPEFKAKKAKRG